MLVLTKKDYCDKIQITRRAGMKNRLAKFLHRCHCPYCGSSSLSTYATRDGIDPMSLNPFRRLLEILGSPIRYCRWCRLQFHDPRPVR